MFEETEIDLNLRAFPFQSALVWLILTSSSFRICSRTGGSAERVLYAMSGKRAVLYEQWGRAAVFSQG